ncbi:MAG: helix-turn-helix domain-containing protein [Boseongicola sp. SB0676_bin_33]|nr:helix-turn-helix domain-containing protein [Boseongicola sp. SB0676_bin_33]MYK32104.1 helix-turn-helix domain-containing protein [Boseongicola sp. SB0670_bin_30]
MVNIGRRLIRSYKCRLYPSGTQEAALSDMRGHFRDLCNAGLQASRDRDGGPRTGR